MLQLLEVGDVMNILKYVERDAATFYSKNMNELKVTSFFLEKSIDGITVM